MSTRTVACRITALAGVAAVLGSASAWAGACDSTRWGGGSPVNITNCQEQVQATVTYGGWDTKGWAYECKGEFPYFWGLDYGYSPSFTTNNHCFSVAENAVNEGDDPSNSKFDATFTNWCLKKETITVTLACSSDPPPSSVSSAR